MPWASTAVSLSALFLILEVVVSKVAEKTFRKNVVLTRSAGERIRRIRESNDMTSDADAIRKALQFYDRMMTAQIGGCAVEIITPTGDRIRSEKLFEPFMIDDAVEVDQLLSY